jgi:hypothetical protein
MLRAITDLHGLPVTTTENTSSFHVVCYLHAFYFIAPEQPSVLLLKVLPTVALHIMVWNQGPYVSMLTALFDLIDIKVHVFQSFGEVVTVEERKLADLGDAVVALRSADIREIFRESGHFPSFFPGG